MDDLRLLADVFPDVPPPGEHAWQLATDRLAAALATEHGEKYVRARPPRRRRVLVWSAIAVPAVAVLVVLGLVVVPGRGQMPSTAAAVLDQAAAAAGQGQPSPGPGEYEYTETETRYRVTFYMPQGGDAPLVAGATGYLDETDQAWTDAAGQGHHLVTVGSAHFASASAQAMWDAATQGSLGTSLGLPAAGQEQTQQPILSATGLPTDPTRLASFIAQQRIKVSSGEASTGGDVSTGVSSSDAYHLTDGVPYTVFEGAAVLLVGPTAGMTPALASALFKVMADQPGAQLLGTVADHDGQSGEAVSGSASSTEVDQVVVDPTTGKVLEAQFVSPPSTMPPVTSCSGPAGETTGTCVTPAPTKPVAATTPTWTDVVASGVVSLPTATLPPTGTIRPVATVVPGPPTHVTVTDLPGDQGVRVAWTPPTDTGTGPVTGYVVHEANASGVFSVPDTGGRTATTELTVPDGTPAGTYTVQAENAAGTGPASTPAKAPPAAPAGSGS